MKSIDSTAATIMEDAENATQSITIPEFLNLTITTDEIYGKTLMLMDKFIKFLKWAVTSSRENVLSLIDKLWSIMVSNSKIAMFTKMIFSSKGLRRIMLSCLILILIIANIWGMTTGALLSKLFRKQIKRNLGVSYDNIKFNPFLLRLTMTKIVLCPCASSLARMIVLLIYPSADVVTHPPLSLSEKRKTTHHGSKIEVASIMLYLSIKMRKKKSTVGENEDDDTSSHETLGETSEGAERKDDQEKHPPISNRWVSLKLLPNFPNFSKGMKHLMRILHRWISKIGVKPRISFVVNGVRVNVDKAYLAPDDIDETKSLAGRFLKHLPTFSSYCTMGEEEIGAANSFTFYIEQWLERECPDISTSALSTPNKNKNARTKKDRASTEEFTDFLFEESFETSSSEAESLVTSTSRTSFKSGSSSTESQNANPTKKVEDPSDTFLQRSIRVVFSTIVITVQDFAFVVTGASAKDVLQKRSTFLPHIATLSIAEIPRSQRAMTVVGAKEVSLTFVGSQCHAVLNLTESYIRVGLPVKEAISKKKKQQKKPKQKTRKQFFFF